MLTYSRYGRRYWAVYESGDLLCVTVYRKGALAVIERVSRKGGRRPRGGPTARGRTARRCSE
jgi:hypothetical protein